MATWRGFYINDFGVEFRGVQLQIYRVVDGLRSATNRDQDASVLPPILAQELSENTRYFCSIANGTRTIRHARAWISSNAWIHIPCPWRGDDPLFATFYQQLQANANLLLIEHHGEHIDPWYSQIFINGP